MPLTDKQQRFCEAYLEEPNATQAAIKAGYSQKTAYSIGQRLLKHVEIKNFLESQRKDNLDQVKKRIQISEEWIINELISNSQQARELKQISASNKALELLGNHLGMFTEKIEVTEGVKIIEDDI